MVHAKRLPQLDILRSFAIFLVLLRHLPEVPDGLGTHWSAAYSISNSVGWIGVDLFFVLSGFLISGLLFREYNLTGKVDLLRFYIRRGYKIYPGFYILFLTTLLAIS